VVDQCKLWLFASVKFDDSNYRQLFLP